MVVLKEDNLPPLRWKLGRITALHPGKDGISSVLSIKTAEGCCSAPLRKCASYPRDLDITPKGTALDSQARGNTKVYGPLKVKRIITHLVN